MSLNVVVKISPRARGDAGYVVTRDWAVKNHSFVYDLSPWATKSRKMILINRWAPILPATYHIMLSELLKQTAGKEMTEVARLFSFSKYSNIPGYESAHDPVPISNFISNLI